MARLVLARTERPFPVSHYAARAGACQPLRVKTEGPGAGHVFARTTASKSAGDAAYLGRHGHYMVTRNGVGIKRVRPLGAILSLVSSLWLVYAGLLFAPLLAPYHSFFSSCYSNVKSPGIKLSGARRRPAPAEALRAAASRVQRGQERSEEEDRGRQGAAAQRRTGPPC